MANPQDDGGCCKTFIDVEMPCWGDIAHFNCCDDCPCSVRGSGWWKCCLCFLKCCDAFGTVCVHERNSPDCMKKSLIACALEIVCLGWVYTNFFWVPTVSQHSIIDQYLTTIYLAICPLLTLSTYSRKPNHVNENCRCRNGNGRRNDTRPNANAATEHVSQTRYGIT